MLNDYEERQTEGFLYSPALDLLLTWGSGSLFQGTEDEGEFVQGIEEEWHSLMEESDVKSELHSGLEALTQDINDALDFLCHAIPESDRETALAQTALEILDHGVRLFQTTRNFSEQNHFPEGFQVRAEALFRNITVDRAPSYIRLIPLNYWRQFMRGNISEHSFHLFPWYDEWADMPSETIEILIENWNEISHGNFECSEMDTETLKVLFAELSNDRELLNYIQEEARFGHILPRAIGKSLVLRLLMIRNEEVGKHAAPQKVREKGFVACACHIIQKIKKIFRSEEERLEGIFLSGFCGPHLRENQRTELFTQVEHELKTLDVSLRPGSLLEELCQWSQGKVADEVFSRRVFEHWNNELSLSAKAVTERVPEDAAIFLRAVNELAFAKLETETVGGSIRSTLKKIYEDMKRSFLVGGFHWQPAQAGGRGSRMSKVTSKSEPLKILSGNFFEMEIESDDGWLDLLSPETDGDENLMRICEFMEDKDYFRGLLAYEEDGWQALGEVESETGMPLGTDDPEKDILLLCIGLDEDAVSDALRKAVSALNVPTDIGAISEEPETSLSFAWICYQVTRNED